MARYVYNDVIPADDDLLEYLELQGIDPSEVIVDSLDYVEDSGEVFLEYEVYVGREEITDALIFRERTTYVISPMSEDLRDSCFTKQED